MIQVADNRWYWYQRYHHLLVDGFSFPAITRQIANIYCAWLRGEPTPASPFTPFADVVEEYQQYRESEAWQRDAAFWAEQRRQLPPPASLSPAPLPGRSASADILRLKLEFTDGEFRQLATQLSGVQRTDLALALAALWLGRLCNRMDYAAGFIFMRRLGSAALTATGPVLNVLPLGIHIAAQETLPQLATRLAAQLKKMRRHQRYDAEQIVRDSGRAAGDEPLFGPVLNIKVFDYQLDIPGVQAQTHTLATGPVNDLELALFPDEHGDLSIEILANKQRYDEPTLIQHAERLKMLIAQFAADPALLCGDVDIMLPGEYVQLAQINATQVEIPETTLSALVAEQAAKTPDAPALADARYLFSYREMREQVVTAKAGWCAVMRLVKDNGVERRLHRRELAYLSADELRSMSDKALGALRLKLGKDLNLTDAQKQQIREIMKGQRDQMKRPPLEERRAMHDIIASDTFDKAKAEAQIAKMEEQRKANMLAHMETQNKIYNILTPEQKKQFNANFEKRLTERPAAKGKMPATAE